MTSNPMETMGVLHDIYERIIEVQRRSTTQILESAKF
jgi:hypothetical protein